MNVRETMRETVVCVFELTDRAHFCEIYIKVHMYIPYCAYLYIIHTYVYSILQLALYTYVHEWEIGTCSTI